MENIGTFHFMLLALFTAIGQFFLLVVISSSVTDAWSNFDCFINNMEKFTAGTPSSEWTIPVWIGLPLYEHLLLDIFILKIKVIHVFVNISYRIV